MESASRIARSARLSRDKFPVTRADQDRAAGAEPAPQGRIQHSFQPMERKKCQVLPALTKVSFIIARHLDSENLYTQFLTPSESQIFKDAVTNFDKWSLFITATDSFDTAKGNGDDELQGKELQSSKMSDEQVAAFRVRAMIFDQLVPQLYKCSKPCCKHSNAIDNIIQGFSTDKYDKIIEGSSDSDPYIHNQAPAVVLQPPTEAIPQNTNDTTDDETAPPGTILTSALC